MTRDLDTPPDLDSATLAIPPGPVDPPGLARRISSSLAAHGWAHVAGEISDEEFEALGRCLGTIELRTDLLVDPERASQQRRTLGDDARGRPVLYEAEGMDFHTDRPSAAVLGWRCLERDADGGESRFLDLRDIAGAFSPEELDDLGRIEVGYALPDGAGGLEVRYAPLVEPGPEGPLVYWVPWRVRPPRDEAGGRLLERFVAYVRAKQARGPMAVRLERGECLFLENRRMLHGRASLPRDSRRHLVRLYIRRADPA